jgi:LAS superfamily LD-carboxypeptidase LdcB
MKPIARRDFLKLSLAAGLVPLDWKLDPGNTIEIGLPAVDQLEDPLLIRIVDNEHPISQDEIKEKIEPNLVSLPLTMDGILVANEHVRVNKLCLVALSELFKASDAALTGLYVHSGFRSYEEQTYAYNQAADKSTVLLPGISQHHTGLAVDFTSSQIGKVIDVNSGFQKTKAGKWVKEHAGEYGFVQSYTSSHDGIRNESWHYLYIGKPLTGIYQTLKNAGWYGDVFTLQMAMNLGMRHIVLDPGGIVNPSS